MSELFVGQSASMEKRFSYEDVIAFSRLSMDNNPIHINPEYASATQFKKNIVHGFLVGSLFSAIIGTILPGNGTIYLSQNMNFVYPIFHEEMVKAVVTIEKIREDKPIVTLSTKLFNQQGILSIDGIAVVKVSRI